MSWTPHLSKTKVRNFIQNYIGCAESVVPDVRVLPNFELHDSNNSRRSYISWKSHHKVRGDGCIFTHTENFFKMNGTSAWMLGLTWLMVRYKLHKGCEIMSTMWYLKHCSWCWRVRAYFSNPRTQNVLEVKISRSPSLHGRMMTTWDQAWHFTPTP